MRRSPEHGRGPEPKPEIKELTEEQEDRLEDLIESVERVMEDEGLKVGSMHSYILDKFLRDHIDAKKIELKLGRKKITITRDENGYKVVDKRLPKEELEATKRWHERDKSVPESWDRSGWEYGYTEIQFAVLD